MIFLQTYLLIGCVIALVILWASTDKDFDQFVRDFFREEPPTTKEKWFTALSSIVLWPIALYWVAKK